MAHSHSASQRPPTLRHIRVTDLELSCSIGIHDHERRIAQPVIINLDLAVEDQPFDDRLEDVLDYEALIDDITAIVTTGHINLVETLAEKVAEACLGRPDVRNVTIRVDKPQAIAAAAAVGIEIFRDRHLFVTNETVSTTES